MLQEISDTLIPLLYRSTISSLTHRGNGLPGWLNPPRKFLAILGLHEKKLPRANERITHCGQISDTVAQFRARKRHPDEKYLKIYISSVTTSDVL